jgi:hypothetical protein
MWPQSVRHASVFDLRSSVRRGSQPSAAHSPGFLTVRLGTALEMMGTPKRRQCGCRCFAPCILIAHGVWIVLRGQSKPCRNNLHQRWHRPRIEMRHHDELHFVGLQRCGRSKARHDLDAWIVPDRNSARAGHQPDRQRRMVPCPRAHAGQLDGRWDCERFELAPTSNGRAHQDRRRSDRAPHGE